MAPVTWRAFTSGTLLQPELALSIRVAPELANNRTRNETLGLNRQ